MIHINRTPVPSVLDPTEDPDPERQSDGRNETVKNIAEAKKAEPAFTFKVYKDNEVRQALHQLFRGKCAYCESRYLAVQQMDVEHWRPKKAIEKWKGIAAQRGYYWLGSTWSNLLPSCADCNRRREHVDFSAEVLKEGPTLGKRAIFPVEKEDDRWREHDKESHETPLLLNPCEDHPEELLEVSEEGVVREQRGLGRLDRARVRTSIEVYGLNRPGLVHERLAWIRLLEHKMDTIDRVVLEIKAAVPGSNEEGLAEDLLQFLLADLRELGSPHHPYSLTTQQLTEEFLADFE